MLSKEEVIDLITGWKGYTDAEFSCSEEESEELGEQLRQVLEWIEAHSETFAPQNVLGDNQDV